MKFKNKTVGGHPVEGIKYNPVRFYCISAEVFVHTEWLNLTFTNGGILNVNRPESKFNLVKDES